MSEQHHVFDGDEVPRGFHETNAENEAFGGSPFADDFAFYGASEEEIQEYREILERMDEEEGWESVIAAWEAAEKRRSDAKAERERRATENIELSARKKSTQSPTAASGGSSPTSFADLLARMDTRTWTAASSGKTVGATFAGRRGNKIRLRKGGSVITVTLDKLSEADQQWIKTRTKKQTEEGN